MPLLTAFMDETGHCDDPRFHFAGMAGFVAPMEQWLAFGESWQAVLNGFKLEEPFHMKDFAHSEGQFKNGWKDNESKRRDFYGRLINVILETKPRPIGCIVSTEDFKSLTECQRDSFTDPYFVAFQSCTRAAALNGMAEPEEQVAMVYSYNKEYGALPAKESFSIDQAGSAEQLWHAMRAETVFGRWMGSYASSTPAQMVQLQCADLFAYELAKEFENLRTRPSDDMRWGLRQLLGLINEKNILITFLDRLELLRRVKESHFPCQMGVEDVDDLQMARAAIRDLVWLRSRAKTASG